MLTDPSLILNKKIEPARNTIHWETENKVDFDLKKFIEDAVFPRTPKEKFDNLIKSLYNKQNTIGEPINLTELERKSFHSICYFDNYDELIVYIEALYKKGLINYSDNSYISDSIVKMTYEGFNYLLELEDNGAESKICFIAMAFRPETKKIREAIRNALQETGFQPIIIDEKNVESDRTIHDDIFAGIKKCKFCISDFSYHSNGVYFESGFALGLGKPVIYCCSKKEFNEAHFDIKPLQHIIYESEEELKKQLVAKIEAWIK